METIQVTENKFRIEIGRNRKVFDNLKDAKRFLRVNKIYKFNIKFNRRESV